MFDYKHYVPILRWKRGERIALQELFSKDSSHITPLIELIPKDYTEIEIKKASGLEQKLEQAAEQFRMSWGERAFLLDLWHLDNIRLNSENRLHPFVIFNEKARTRSLHMIPVTGFSRSKEYQSAIFSIVKNNREGICLRIYKDNLLNVNFQQNLKTMLQNIDLRPNQVDLLVDLQIVDETCPDLKSICAILPTINDWRSFTIARGAFPKDLTEFSIGEHLVPRNDWLLWFHEVTNNQDLQRIPTFSDYTIQYPLFLEPPKYVNVSASIRYTTIKNWLIMRGEGLRNPGGPGHKQYPAEAQLLCEKPEYCGESYSYGDRYIKELSLHDGSKGTPETLIRAGINHHITFTTRQIASLFGI